MGKHFEPVKRIPLDRLEPDPALPRMKPDRAGIPQLAANMEKRGQRRPITVRRADGQDKYFIIDGRRRWEAAHLTERIRDLECRIVNDPGEEGILIDRAIDGLTHVAVPLLDLGEAIKKLMKRLGWTTKKLRDELPGNISRVRRALALLGLPDQVLEMVRDGELGTSHALEIMSADRRARLRVAFQEL